MPRPLCDTASALQIPFCREIPRREAGGIVSDGPLINLPPWIETVMIRRAFTDFAAFKSGRSSAGRPQNLPVQVRQWAPNVWECDRRLLSRIVAQGGA